MLSMVEGDSIAVEMKNAFDVFSLIIFACSLSSTLEEERCFYFI